MNDLDIIIVSHGDGRWLSGCLASLEARSGGCEYAVLVVENGAPQDAPPPEVLRGPRVRCMRVPNRGFAAANNAALRVTASPLVLFLNPDTELVAGTLAEAVAELVGAPHVGMIAPRQMTDRGAVYPSMRRFPTVRRALAQALGCERWPLVGALLGERILAAAQYDGARDCDWTTGAVMLTRRAAIVSAGDFDERFFLFSEEADLCLRIRQAGWRIRYSPRVSFLHHAGKAGINARREAQAGYARMQFANKHFSRTRASLYRVALMLGYAVRLATARGRRAPSGAASSATLRVLAGLEPPPYQTPCTVADRAADSRSA